MNQKRAIGVVLVISMLLAYLQVPAVADINKKAKSFPVPDAGAVVELEDTTLKEAQGIRVEKDKKASGKCIISEKDWRKLDYQKEDAAVEFFFVPEVDGVYHVWLRYAAAADNCDSVFLSVNGGEYAQAPKTKATGGEDSYVWDEIHTTAALKAGEAYNLRFLPREVGFRMDQVIITNKTITPAGPVKDVNDMGGTPEPPVGNMSGINEKAKEFTLGPGGALFELEDTTFTQELGFAVIDDENASGKKAVASAISRQPNPPTAQEQGAAEFYLVPEKTATYHIWLRYSAKDAGSDSVFLSVDGSAYAEAKNIVRTNDEAVFGWSSIYSATLEAGKRYNFRFIPREKGFKMDQLAVTSLRYTPTGIVTALPDKNEYNITPCDTSRYPAPTITPPPEHPRLLFRASDIPGIKADMDKAENADAKAEFARLVTMDIGGGVLPAAVNNKENYDVNILAAIEARAFDYVINGNDTAGREAIAAIRNYLDTVDFGDTVSVLYRKQGYCVFVASQVYDWCYPLLTQEDKQVIVSQCQYWASAMEIGWPPVKQGAVSGHGSEAQLMRDLLALSIAAYDEYPDMYQMIAGRLLSEYLEPRNFYYQSHTWHQGTSYNPYRIEAGMWMNYLFKVLCGADVLCEEQAQMLYSQLYMRRPDGQMLREGDVMENTGKGVYWTQARGPLFMAANLYGDPYLKREVIREAPDYNVISPGHEGISAVLFLLFNDPDLGQRPLTELPKTRYFGSPSGTMVARTGWSDGYDSDDVLAFMKIGEVYGANHNHLDSGNFQIYYKGILASESGSYIAYGSDYDWAYHKATIAHNSLLIYDPDETMAKAGVPNTGGQRGPSGEFATFQDWQEGSFDTKFATVLGYEFGPDPVTPAYSYIKGDLTNAYSDKVNEVLRSMLFMPTDDAAHPAVFLVMDKISASNKDFDKYWIMHGQQEPEIDGNVSVIKRDTDGYNGKLVNQTLYPKDAAVTAIGGEGHENEFNGVTYPDPPRFGKTSCEEIATWRIDVRPTVKQETDYFLNAMYVGEADETLPLIQAELIETEQMLGAKLLGKVALFAKDVPKLTEQSFTVPGDETALDFVVAGLDAGSYEIVANGNTLPEQIATAEGGVIYFTGPAGTYTVMRKDAGAVRQPVEAEVTAQEIPIKIKVGTKYIYSDVDPVTVNDRTLLPMRALFENIGAQVEYDGATSSATATDGTTTVTITEGSDTAYVNGQPVTLDVSAIIVNDRFMVPVRFISESMGLEVGWSETGKVVTISGVVDYSVLEGYGIPKRIAKVSDVTCLALLDGRAAAEPWLAQNAIDLDPGTLWAEEGDGRWIQFTLDREYNLEAMAAMFNNAATRTESFSLEISADGENWTKVIDHATTDGKTEDFQQFAFATPVAAKFVRYIGHGNSSSGWSALKEIVFVPVE